LSSAASRPKIAALGQAEEPRAERDDRPERGVDDRHYGQIAGKVSFDVAHDLEETQLGVAAGEQRNDARAQFKLAAEKEQQSAEEQE